MYDYNLNYYKNRPALLLLKSIVQMNWQCHNAHSLEPSTTRVQHYLVIFLFRSNSRWEGNFCYTWYKKKVSMSFLKFSFSFKKWIYRMFIYVGFSLRKKVCFQNDHKLNHIFQKNFFSACSNLTFQKAQRCFLIRTTELWTNQFLLLQSKFYVQCPPSNLHSTRVG